jgi:hypothetical protein
MGCKQQANRGANSKQKKKKNKKEKRKKKKTEWDKKVGPAPPSQWRDATWRAGSPLHSSRRRRSVWKNVFQSLAVSHVSLKKTKKVGRK